MLWNYLFRFCKTFGTKNYYSFGPYASEYIESVSVTLPSSFNLFRWVCIFRAAEFLRFFRKFLGYTKPTDSSTVTGPLLNASRICDSLARRCSMYHWILFVPLRIMFPWPGQIISGFCLAIVPKDDMYSRKFLTLDDELPKIVSPLNKTLSTLNE